MPDTSHVIIVGAGFAGVACAKRLADDPRVRVTVLDRAGHHQFPATALPGRHRGADRQGHRLRPAAGVRRAPTNVDARTAEAASVNPAPATVTLTDGRRHLR